MAILSKEEFREVLKDQVCQSFAHPWSPTCLGGLWDAFLSAISGCAKFSVALSVLQIASKNKNITREQLFNIIEHGVRLTLCGVSFSTVFIGAICAQRNLLGKFYHNTAILVPGFLSGSSIFIVRRPMRHFFISAVACATIETIINVKWRRDGRISSTRLTLFFMLANSLFMYFLKLWKLNKTGFPIPELWFFTPSHSTRNENCRISNTSDTNVPDKQPSPCEHIQSCIRSILKETSNYFWYGTVVGVLRITIANYKLLMRNPKKLMSFVCQVSTLRMAAFVGLYVFLFKITNCALCRAYGKDRPLNSLIAGFISGMSCLVYPNVTLTVTVFVNMVHVIWRYYGINQKYLQNFHTSELLFMIACGILIQLRVTAPDHCSRFFNNMISFTSGGKSDEMYAGFKKILLARCSQT